MSGYPWFEPAWADFSKRLASSRLAHGLLIVAEPGAAVAELATAMAARLLCKTPTADDRACGLCTDCRLQIAGSHPDGFKVGLEANSKGDLSKVIRIDQIRELSAQMALTAQRGGRKVALIQPADQLNVEAANALLKTLEEPPENSYLLLSSEYPKRLPATILSRCQRISVGRISDQALLAWLRTEVGAREDDLTLSLALAAGPLDARELIRSGALKEARQVLEQMIKILGGARSPIGWGAELVKLEPARALGWLLSYLRLAIGLRLGLQSGLSGPVNDNIHRLAQARSSASLCLLLEQLQRIILGLKAPLKHDLLIDAWASTLAFPP